MKEKGEPLFNLKPAHKLSLNKIKGQWQALCICGWVGSKSTEEEDARLAYRLHTGLKERPR